MAQGWFLARAVALAVLAMLFGIVCAVLWVTVYSEWIDPGRGLVFYEAYAARIVPWLGIGVGVPALFVAGRHMGRARTAGVRARRSVSPML